MWHGEINFERYSHGIFVDDFFQIRKLNDHVNYLTISLSPTYQSLLTFIPSHACVLFRIKMLISNFKNLLKEFFIAQNLITRQWQVKSIFISQKKNQILAFQLKLSILSQSNEIMNIVSCHTISLISMTQGSNNL